MIFYIINTIEAIDQKRELLIVSNLSKYLWTLLFTLLFFGCSEDTEKSADQLFEILSNEHTGIDFNNQLKDTPELNILSYLYYYNGAGIAVADFNNDGFDDLFFASNSSSNELYLNNEQLKFEKVSKEANINIKGWSTGVTVVDINNDGLLDVYVCQLGNYKSFDANNLLYVNQGINNKGIPSFKEEAKKYGLNFSGLSTQAAFFDYDLDGDLDMYLLNHSVHPVRNYGRGNNRLIPDKTSGDKLFRNDNGFYIDATSDSGIYSSKIGYGLGIGISDLNNDNYPDIYIGNDFFENDYLYINQKNGTFKEIISENRHKLGHTSHFSMGNDLADFNNDGYIDILSMDMLPEDLITYKSSGNEYEYNIYKEYLKNGYSPQYMQNTMHLNNGNNTFSEIAFLSGVSASEWSWSGLFMDFDNDGFKDIFISNGIYGATNDMDYINFISNENIQKRLSKGMSEEDMEMINEIPQKKVANYFFKNNGDLTFSKLKNDQKSFSNGAIYSDLDNDGDLDIVTNNLNQDSFVYKNLSKENGSNNHYLKINFNGNTSNKLGIGAKIIIHTNNQKQIFENYLTRGYMSSVSPKLNVGLGNSAMIDSLAIIWPGGKTEKLKAIAANQIISLAQSNAVDKSDVKNTFKENLDLADSLNLDFVHIEHDSYEFNRDPLAPYMSSNLGPKISVADINDDGLDDVFIGNGKREDAKLLLQTKKGFIEDDQLDIKNISITENNDNQFFDADGDGDLDLIIGNGGNEYKKDPPLKPSLFINEKGKFRDKSERLPDIYSNISVVSISDFDNDDDLDLFLGTSSVTGSFGETGKSHLLENDGSGNFKEITLEKSSGLQNIGLIRDAKWIDLNNDNYLDLVVIGHWMPMTIFMNDSGVLKKETNNGLEETNGLYNTMAYDDFDKDGDLDFILGNWGVNSRLKASVEEPITLYRYDFDDNGKTDPIMTYYDKGQVTVFATKDELMKQIPSLNKRFLSYNDFARADFQDLFEKEKIENAEIKKVYNLKSCIAINDGNGKFEIKNLPDLAQISSVNTIAIKDFDSDGYPDALIAGNNYQINTQLGQLDASHGLILMNDKKGNLIPDVQRSNKYPLFGAIRDIKEIKIKDKLFLMIARNNDSLQIIDKSCFSHE